MPRLKTRVLAAVSVSLLVLAMSTLTHDTAQGAAGSAPVTVVNSPSEAVPVSVQGTATIGGTVNTNVTNTPNVTAFQGGAWNVGLTGSLAAVPAAPPEPFSSAAEFVGTTQPLFGPVAAGKRIAVTNFTFGNQVDPVFLTVMGDDCAGNLTGGFFRVFLAGGGTVSVPLPTPMVFNGPCLLAVASLGGPIRVVNVVGYLITP